MHYNYFRDYEPGAGRYVQSDPIGLEGGLNTYIYANSNSVYYIDPTGENAVGIAIGGLGADLSTPDPTDVALWKWLGWAAVIGGAVIYDLCTNEECDPPAGTICYFIDRVPTSKPHYPYPGSHYHLFQMNQAPNGQCFWNKIGASRLAPPGAIPCPFQRNKSR